MVRDEGVGYRPADAAAHFRPVPAGRRSIDRSHSGLGIGLTVVKHLVEMHGGRVEVRSEGLGKGSEFRVRSAARRGRAGRGARDGRTALHEPCGSGACWWSRTAATPPSRCASCCDSTITKSKWCTTVRERAVEARRFPRRHGAARHRIAAHGWLHGGACHPRALCVIGRSGPGSWHSPAMAARKTATPRCARASTGTWQSRWNRRICCARLPRDMRQPTSSELG